MTDLDGVGETGTVLTIEHIKAARDRLMQPSSPPPPTCMLCWKEQPCPTDEKCRKIIQDEWDSLTEDERLEVWVKVNIMIQGGWPY